MESVIKDIATRLSSEQKALLRGIGLASVNLSLGGLFFLFAYANLSSFIEEPRLSVLLMVLTETIVGILLIARRDPVETRHTWQTWVTTTCGTFLPMLLRPLEHGQDLLAGQMLQVVGMVIQISALIALGRSLGLLPANRGIQSAGLYRFVRHPLYASYLLTFTGYLICNPTVQNGLIVIFGVTFLVLRIRYEEELLRQYPDYAIYADTTRWRLLPAIW